jgi:hypothetical protein
MDLMGMSFENVDWIHLARDRVSCGDLVYTEMESRFLRRREFLNEMREDWLLKKDFHPWSKFTTIVFQTPPETTVKSFFFLDHEYSTLVSIKA